MKARQCFGLIAFLAAPIGSVLQAAGLENTNSTLQVPPVSGGLWGVFFQMMGALIFVVSIFVLGAWLFQKSRFFPVSKSGPAQLQILESRSLGYRNGLLVVGYNQQRFLLATSATGINLLSPLPDAGPTAMTGNVGTSFAGQLDAVQLDAARERKT